MEVGRWQRWQRIFRRRWRTWRPRWHRRSSASGAGGSGVVVGTGLVVTNAHNIRHDEVVVTFADGRRAEGRPAGVDVDGDLAVVSVDTGDAPALPVTGASVRMGDAVLALANPGGRAVRVSVGIVSATDVAFRGPGGRRVGGAIEHTAPLARGSSGGPVVDVAGRPGRHRHPPRR